MKGHLIPGIHLHFAEWRLAESSFLPVLEFLTDPGDASRTISRLSRDGEGVWRIRGENIQEEGYKFVPSPRGNPSIVI